MAVKKGLGKGLDALIPSGNVIEPKKTLAKEKESSDKSKPETTLKISLIEPNRDQPRHNFDEDALEELSESVKQYGILEPILVVPRGEYYQIVAGERRWRAAQLAGLKEVPVIIRNLTEQEIVEIALIENIQREDLNPIEEAQAYKKLITEFNMKQDEVADKVSKSRTAVTNSMRLLKLCENVQNMLINDMLSTGHARTLLAIEDPEKQYEIAQRIFDEKLSVRDVEKLVKDIGKPEKKKKEKDRNESLEAVYQDIQEKMKQKLNTKVEVIGKGDGSGKISIEFYSHDDLERILEQLN